MAGYDHIQIVATVDLHAERAFLFELLGCGIVVHAIE